MARADSRKRGKIPIPLALPEFEYKKFAISGIDLSPVLSDKQVMEFGQQISGEMNTLESAAYTHLKLLDSPGYRRDGKESLKKSEMRELAIAEKISDLVTKRDNSQLKLRIVLDTMGRDLKWEGPYKETEGYSLVEKAAIMVHDKLNGKDDILVNHANIVIPEPNTKIKGSIRPKGCVAARVYQAKMQCNPDHQRDVDWSKLTPSEYERSHLAWLPPGSEPYEYNSRKRFIVPTRRGELVPFDPETGLPLETIIGYERAIKRWEKAGLTRQEAIKQLTSFEFPGTSNQMRAISGRHNGYKTPNYIQLVYNNNRYRI